MARSLDVGLVTAPVLVAAGLISLLLDRSEPVALTAAESLRGTMADKVWRGADVRGNTVGNSPPEAKSKPIYTPSGSASSAASPDAALGMLRGLGEMLESDDGRAEEALNVLRKYVSNDSFESTLEWICANLEGQVRERAIDEIFGILSSSSPQAALAWLAGQDSSEGWNSAVSVSLSALAESDGEAAASWLGTNPDYRSRENIEIIISRWGRQAPDRTLQWVRTLPTTREMHAALLPGLLSVLRTESAMKIVLAGLGTGDADEALQAASTSTVLEDPMHAARLASRIQDPTKRENQMARLRKNVKALL